MNKSKSILALLLALVVALCTLTACSSTQAPSSDESAAPTESAGTDEGTESAEPTTGNSGKTRPTTSGQADNSFTVALIDQITTLDPELFMKQAEDNVIVNVYDPLFYLDNDSNIVCALAESYVENEDGSVDVTLRSNVKFHSGDILTAQDVAYTLSRCTNSPLCSVLVGAMEITVTDDTHLTLTFPGAGAGAGFHDLMPYIQTMAIVNQSYCETIISDPNEDLGLNVDGTGSYKVEEISANGDVTLTRFEDAWSPASIDTIYFKYITGSQETAFEAGDLDYAMYGASNYQIIKEYDNVLTQEQVLNNVAFLICNCVEGTPTSDQRVRDAIAHCLNIDELATIASGDAGTPAYNMATPLVEYYADVAEHVAVDVEQANALMTEAGYSESNPLELTLIVQSAYPDWVSGCEIMKEMLEQSYFVINIEQVPDSSRYFIQDFDLAMISIGLTSQFGSFAQLYETGSSLNLAGINDADVQAAFAAMTDEASTQNAMKVATECRAYIPIYYATTFFAFDANLNPGPFYTQFSAFMYRDFSWK
ncbi:MAG: ABC transporter substrate-binding protein [Candidatus Spyradocola sp.]|jgi:peptide/nickel transport system substrate-binding protein